MRKRVGIVVGMLLIVAGLVSPLSAGASGGAGTVLRDEKAAAMATPYTPGPIGLDTVQPDTTIEPSIAVNPSNPLNAVAVYQEGRIDSGGDADNGWATTMDGGKTWTNGYLPGLTHRLPGAPANAYDRASDAVVAFGPNNTVYAQSLVFDQDTGTTRSGMAVNVSRDGGLTWGPPVFLEADDTDGSNDKNWLAVDMGTGPGHHFGRVYVVWDRGEPVIYTYCDPEANQPAGCDNLKNWSNAPENNGAFYPMYPGQGIGAIPLILPDGTLAVVFTRGTMVHFPNTENPAVQTDKIVMALAKSAGSTPFPAPLPFTQVPIGVASESNKTVAEQRAGTLPAAAADPATGRIFVAWEDGRFRSDNKNDLVVTYSDDQMHWSPVKRINDDPTDNDVDHWNPMIDVGTDGVVHAAYRQREETPGPATPASARGYSPYIDTYYQESTDHGATWGSPLKVDVGTYDNGLPSQTDVRYAAYSRNGAFLGDYNQVAAASNGWTYLVRNEAAPSYPGEPCNCSFTEGNGHQHQYTWVAVIGAEPTATLAETPWTVALLGAGFVVMAWALRRRRPSSTGPAASPAC
jgi:hypothetical protein